MLRVSGLSNNAKLIYISANIPIYNAVWSWIYQVVTRSKWSETLFFLISSQSGINHRSKTIANFLCKIACKLPFVLSDKHCVADWSSSLSSFDEIVITGSSGHSDNLQWIQRGKSNQTLNMTIYLFQCFLVKRWKTFSKPFLYVYEIYMAPLLLTLFNFNPSTDK